VVEITGGKKANVVFDPIGLATFEASLDSLRGSRHWSFVSDPSVRRRTRRFRNHSGPAVAAPIRAHGNLRGIDRIPICSHRLQLIRYGAQPEILIRFQEGESPMSFIKVGQETSTPIEIYYGDHSSGSPVSCSSTVYR
jgi:hypothetical protein